MELSTAAATSGSASSGQRACVNSMASQVRQITKTINDNEGIQSAMNSLAFQEATLGWTVSYYSTNEVWSFSDLCVVTLQDVNQVFELSNGSRPMLYAVAIEDVHLRVATIWKTPIGPVNTVPSLQSPIFSGYQFYSNSGGTAPVYQADASWNVPKPYQPPTNNCNNYCKLETWVGIEPYSGAKLVQAGSESLIACSGSSCLTSYSGWYEYYPNNPVPCPAPFPVGQSDSYYASVVSEAEYGGNVNTYDILILDYSTNKMCTNTSNFNQGTPQQGDFLLEEHGGLAQFNTLTLTGDMYVNGAVVGISHPYSNGWGLKLYMYNCGFLSCQTNTGNSEVYSAGSFDINWISSQYT